MTTKPVVVGVDGSEESMLAAEWAAMEAKRYNRPLRIVSAPATMPLMLAGQASSATVVPTLREMSARAWAGVGLARSRIGRG
jgi:nucleotide-binding universal stress UspA family protein